MLDLAAFEAFIFDLDGTLIDSEKQHVRAFGRAMEELSGHRLSAAERREFSGNTSLDFSAELAARHGLSLSPEAVAERKFALLYQEFRAELFPGAREFLDLHRDRTRLALASNSPLHFVSRALGELGIPDVFEVVTTIDDVARRKPDPGMILTTLSRLDLPAEDALVFEDSSAGVAAALSADCQVVVLRNPGCELPSHLPESVPVATWRELCDMSAT